MDSVTSALSKYFEFKGRSTRKEFWTFYFFTIIAAIVFGFIDGLFGISGLSNLVAIGLTIPTISCGVRRLHDAGKNGWFIIVPIANLIFLLTPSIPAETQN